MRALTLIGSAMGLVAASGAVAQPSKPIRAALVISMSDAARGTGNPIGPVDGKPTPSTSEASPPTAGFRVHDLSRRWVEYQMASAFTHLPGVAAGASEDSFAPVGAAQPQVPFSGASVAPVSAIPIPTWMRGGSVFAAASATYVPGCAPTEYRPSGLLTGHAEYRRRGYYRLMANIACQYGIPVGLFDAMIIRESRYNAAIYSPKNAFGLTQLMPDTAAGLGVNRYDVEQNLRGGARYLREQLDRFGQYHLALAAYNAGPGRVRNGKIPPFAETQAYVSNILLNWSGLSLPQSAQGEVTASGDRLAASRSTVVTSF
ncbi:lytic transglycosylase domain-containing protein [Sphingomonas panaciterrae]|jgi:hypothetical protein|uniref:lytic transglycosylase domain-containing protein n=1 Tax=Sphingomonas panaciterrae TaxID=1462999 RepID=UPI002FF240AF